MTNRRTPDPGPLYSNPAKSFCLGGLTGQAPSQLWPRSEGVVVPPWQQAALKLCSVGWKEKVAVVARQWKRRGRGDGGGGGRRRRGRRLKEEKATEAGKLTMSFPTVMLFLLASNWAMEPHAVWVSDCSGAWR